MQDKLLSEQFHAAFDVEPRITSLERLRSRLISTHLRPRRGRSLRLRLMTVRWVAAALLLALAVASAGAFIAINQYVHRTVPARTPPFKVSAPGVGVCYGSCLVGDPLFVSRNLGFLFESTVTPCLDKCPPHATVLFR